MIIEPKVREYICTTAHPQGCAESVRNQADYACKQGMVNGTKKALIIGCSTGYGLASRICALENCGADTLGIMFERQANGRRTATPGWYNTAEFHRLASGKGVYAKTINGDAFSKEIKEKAIELIKKDLGKVDLVVYSLAAPRRTDAEGKTWSSCLKTTDEPFTEKSLDLRNNEITEKTVEPATEEEVLSTVKVMGGEDWADWIDALKAADVLTEGCAESVRNQADYACKQGMVNGTKKALIIGCSTGYGLASRICALENCGADTLGIMFERQANGRRTATPGWYNTAEFHRLASGKGVYAKTINGDAFSKEIKEKAIELIKKDLGKVDLVVYSLAAPRRTDAEGKTWSSCLKTTDEPFTEKSLDLRNNEITEKTVEPATEEEVLSTVKVMGGEDWADWIDALKAADVLTENAVTVAYSYIGPELTYPIYYHGTIGTAKQHLQKTMSEINQAHPDVCAVISVNKGLVTQASAAIPVVPLYFAILYKVMKKAGNHENCIQQIARLFTQKLYTPTGFQTDENGFIRMDDYELTPEIQEEVKKCWKAVTTDTVKEYCDIDGYWEDFYHMFGFRYEDIDYTQDVDADIEIDGVVM